jgi:hypothetical protein
LKGLAGWLVKDDFYSMHLRRHSLFCFSQSIFLPTYLLYIYLFHLFQFAPACVITETGGLVNLDLCRTQHVGIRKTLAIAYAWLTWTILFFYLARRLALRKQARELATELEHQKKNQPLYLQEERPVPSIGAGEYT